MASIRCHSYNILQCDSAERIRIILSEYNNIINDKDKTSENILKQEVNLLINKTLTNKQYSNTKLLNDFIHLKQFHNINNDNNQFEIMYNYLTENNIIKPCNMDNCSTVRRHYRQHRHQARTQQTNKRHRSYTIDLISR
eukprot:44394_1